jgi:hypothetical protein
VRKGAEGESGIQADGRFRSPVLPVGTYGVAILPPLDSPPGSPKIPARYANTVSSGLIVEIEPDGTKVVEFNLTDDVPNK